MISDAKDFGTRLRRLRQARNMSGRDLAERSGLNQPKISRLETGELPPRHKDVEAVARGLDLKGEEETELHELARHDLAARSTRSRTPGRFRRSQEELLTAEMQATEIWQFEGTLIPAALQVPGYAASVIRGAEEERGEIFRVRMERAALLHDKSRQFRFLIENTALPLAGEVTDEGPPLAENKLPDDIPPPLDLGIALEQMHRITLAAHHYPRIQIRILSPALRRRLQLFTGFKVYDRKVATVETNAGLSRHTEPDVVSRFVDDFELAWRSTGHDESLALLGEHTEELRKRLRDTHDSERRKAVARGV